jgi:hypothetical protein
MLKNNINRYAPVILIFGIIAYVSKITTVFTVSLIMAYYFYESFIAFLASPLSQKTGIRVIILGIVCVLIPFCCGLMWTKWTDYVKETYGQAWLTSDNLWAWNFGTLHEKLNLMNWKIIVKRMLLYFSPVGWLCSLSVFLFAKSRQDLKLLCIIMLSIISTIFIFFNLYKVHDYYMIAIAPEICIVLGYGMYCVVDHSMKNVKYHIIIAVTFFYILALPLARSYFHLYFSTPAYFMQRENLLLASYINANSSDKDHVLIMDEDWSSEILFYANREGFMLKEEAEKTLPQRDYFSIVTLKNEGSHEEILSKLEPLVFLNEIGRWKIYKVTK